MELSALPYAPAGVNVVCGSLNNVAATLLTIPAGRTFIGEIVISAAIASTAARSFQPAVMTQNVAGIFPQNAILARLWLQTGATSGSNVYGSQAFAVTIVNATSSATTVISLITGNSGTETTANFTMNGVLV